MNQQVKKPAGQTGQTSAKIASGAASKMSGAAYQTAESAKAAAQNVVDISTSAVREMLSSGTGEAQKAQEKIWDMGREGIENLTRGADIWSKMCVELIGICRDNVEAAVECCNTAADVCKNLTTDLAESCNRSFSESVELGKEALTCRTINDVADLHSKAVKQCVDTCFSEANKLCNTAFEAATETMEPINERVADASEKLAKVMSTAA